MLLFAVELHGGIGLYRLAVKWGWFAGNDPKATRSNLKKLKWALTAFFLVLGLATLAAYVKIGFEQPLRPRRTLYAGLAAEPTAGDAASWWPSWLKEGR